MIFGFDGSDVIEPTEKDGRGVLTCEIPVNPKHKNNSQVVGVVAEAEDGDVEVDVYYGKERLKELAKHYSFSAACQDYKKRRDAYQALKNEMMQRHVDRIQSSMEKAMVFGFDMCEVSLESDDRKSVPALMIESNGNESKLGQINFIQGGYFAE